MLHVNHAHLPFRSSVRRLLTTLIFFSCSLAYAQPQIQVSPPVSNLSIGQDYRLSLRWQLSDPSNINGQLRSTEGRLVDGNSGQLLLRIPRALASTVPASVNEILTLSRSNLNQALQRSSGQLRYEREWRNQSNQVIRSSMRINLLSSQYAGLAIRDIRLQFESGEPELKLAKRDELIYAFAEISYQGRGDILNYQWEIAEPAGTQGDARYFVLQAGQRSLRGASPLRIRSPALPSWVQGLYQLRFVINKPQNRTAQLRYQVRPNLASAEIALLAPKDSAVLQNGQIFSWKPYPLASAYQLEIYQGSQRLSGVLIAAEEQPGTPLSQLARQRLDSGCSCQWRVIAYGDQGQIQAISKRQNIKIPAR